jgi:hypothetical protein
VAGKNWREKNWQSGWGNGGALKKCDTRPKNRFGCWNFFGRDHFFQMMAEAMVWQKTEPASTKSDLVKCHLETHAAGLPDVSYYNIPKRGEICIPVAHKITKWQWNTCTEWPKNIPHGQQIHQHIYYIPKHSKVYPNWDFWYDSIPSGNPADVSWFSCQRLRDPTPPKISAPLKTNKKLPPGLSSARCLILQADRFSAF